jgi:hypothetical protein
MPWCISIAAWFIAAWATIKNNQQPRPEAPPPKGGSWVLNQRIRIKSRDRLIFLSFSAEMMIAAIEVLE